MEEDDFVDFLKAGNLCHSGIMPPSNVGGDDPEVEKRKIDGHMGPDFCMKRGVWGIGGRGFLPGSVLLSMRGGFRHVIILVRFRLKLCHLIRWNRAY